MTLNRLAQIIMYGRTPNRPADISAVRWSGMVKMATKLVKDSIK